MGYYSGVANFEILEFSLKFVLQRDDGNLVDSTKNSSLS